MSADVPQQLLLSQEGAVVIAVGDLVVRVAPHPTRDPDAAVIGLAIRDATLAAEVSTAISQAIANAVGEPTERPVVHLRSRKRLAEVSAQLSGAIALVGVTPRNGRRLVELVSGCRAAGAAGVQLVWDGSDAAIERHVFAALEFARSTPASAPVVLSRHERPAAALAILIAHRARKEAR
jgi:hypothetical protein